MFSRLRNNCGSAALPEPTETERGGYLLPTLQRGESGYSICQDTGIAEVWGRVWMLAEQEKDLTLPFQLKGIYVVSLCYRNEAGGEHPAAPPSASLYDYLAPAITKIKIKNGDIGSRIIFYRIKGEV